MIFNFNCHLWGGLFKAKWLKQKAKCFCFWDLV